MSIARQNNATLPEAQAAGHALYLEAADLGTADMAEVSDAWKAGSDAEADRLRLNEEQAANDPHIVMAGIAAGRAALDRVKARNASSAKTAPVTRRKALARAAGVLGAIAGIGAARRAEASPAAVLASSTDGTYRFRAWAKIDFHFPTGEHEVSAPLLTSENFATFEEAEETLADLIESDSATGGYVERLIGGRWVDQPIPGLDDEDED
jgi:hypothetical protein